MKKNASTKPNLFIELIERKAQAQKNKESNSNSFSKFQPKKPRNLNNSNVGPSWGGRKGN